MGLCGGLRVFHSRRNWLGKGTIYRIQKPYSCSSTCFACTLPIAFIAVICTYIAYTALSDAREDGARPITIKDASPHWRLSSEYYNHFYESVKLEVLNPSDLNNNFSATLYQYYEADGDSRTFECEDFIDFPNPYIANLTKNNATVIGSLCYGHDDQDKRFELCLDNDESATNEANLEISSFAYNCDDCEGHFHSVQDLTMKPGLSVIVTLQLWIEYTWKDGNKLSKLWWGNTFEVKSIDYVPYGVCNNGKYGIEIKMAREVYEINDSQSLEERMISIMSMMGGVWTFLGLFFSGLAICFDAMIYFCCKRVERQDMEFAIKFNKLENERYKVGADDDTAIEMTST